MSYQVLARKWRPRQFSELVGQEHVLRALINGLDNDRLHHAFLFTGTRGVGKTTVARILAKSLNCEKGVSATPCGECSACREIDEGRFVDLIEVDAASRTKVEDTRELLDNVLYAPSRGRFKVYLIDEVHMLSNHSFNALLKTLEEPPPHVKFLLATTDPQKLPVTILSRCLQFNLRRLPADAIRGHLVDVLGREGVPFEPEALEGVARAADGSMRDALSLLDQAIAYGAGSVRTAEVGAMLGTIDRTLVLGLLEALAEGGGPVLLERAGRVAEQAPDYAGVLAELISLLHRIALQQVVPDAVPEDPAVVRLAQSLLPEDVQLYYQMALLGRRDLPLAPDPRDGFEMVLLRMLAFRPAASGTHKSAAGAPEAAARPRIDRAPAPAPEVREPAPVSPVSQEQAPAPQEPATSPPASGSAAVPSPGEADWHSLVQGLGLTGVLQQLALNSALVEQEGDIWRLSLDPSCRGLHTKAREERLGRALSEYLGRPARLSIEIVEPGAETPAARRRREEAARHAQAEQSIHNDANVQAIVEQFDAEIAPDSIRPLD